MNNILVPTDFSEYAQNACFYAIELASSYNASLTVFHAYHIPIVDPLMPSEYLSDLADSAEKEVNNSMEELVQKLKDYSASRHLTEVPIKHDVTMGFAVDEIINIGEKLEPDLIVMGRRYTEGMAKILLGSITSSVLEKAKQPVLIIPENHKVEKMINNVLYASEFDEADIQTIQRLLAFTKPLNAKVHFVHITLEKTSNAEQKLAELRQTYDSEISMDYIDFENITSEDVMEGLSNYAVSNNVDLMAMLTHKRGFFTKIFDRSFTKAVAFKTNIPLIVFHNQA